MLCAPPLCQPATHFLGCFSLRTGAAWVLIADAAYGLTLVVLHAILLGQVKEPASEIERIRESNVRRLQAESVLSASASEPEQTTTWFIQMLDLDIGFGHQLMGLSDQMNIVVGLLYGVMVTGVSLYMLQAVLSGNSKLPALSRWFNSFAHLQILIYMFISLVKLPKLCKPIQKEYLPHLYMECKILWYIYVQRVGIGVIIGSLGTWIFASYSFVLTFGHGAHSAIDREEYGMHMELPNYGDGSGPAKGNNGRVGSSLAPPGRPGLVGPAVHAPPGGGGGGGYYDRPATASRIPGSHLGGAPSYNVGRMPRASSSMQTHSTAHEHHPLIKPPVAIY